jgi:hypothetical protein
MRFDVESGSIFSENLSSFLHDAIGKGQKVSTA